MLQYFLCVDAFINVPRNINRLVDLQQDSAEERSKRTGVGTLINRFAEGFEVVAADTGRIYDNHRNNFALSSELAWN